MPHRHRGPPPDARFDLTDDEFRALTDFLLFTGTINTQNWPPNDAG